MKKLIFPFFVFACAAFGVEILTEGKVGYLVPTNNLFRDMCGKDSIIGSLESSFGVGRHFYPFASVGFWGNTHHPSIAPGTTHFYAVPIGAGLKYIYPLEHFSVYAGAGALPTYVHLRNDSLDLDRQSKWGCGGILKTGVISQRFWNLFIDLFAEFSYLNIQFQKHERGLDPLILTNFAVGGGIGYYFGCDSCKDQGEKE